MAEVRRYRHIHLRGLGKASEQFRAPGGGSKRVPEPVEDRFEHGSALRKQLDAAVSQMDAYLAEQKIERVPLASRGMPLTITARPHVSLDVGAARSDTRGLKLLNVRRANEVTPDGNDNADQTTLFVTRNMLASLRKNLDQYSQWTDFQPELLHSAQLDEDDDEAEEEKRPRNFWLFETSSSIRPTTLRDLWTDRSTDFLARSKKRSGKYGQGKASRIHSTALSNESAYKAWASRPNSSRRSFGT